MTDNPSPAIYRYKVPVDDRWHDIALSPGVTIHHVAARHQDVVEFWAMGWPDDEHRETRRFRVFGTGHPIEEWRNAAYQGTAMTPGGMFLWHLFERVGTADDRL